MATIIFDLDGTLLDVRLRHYQVYADACRELGTEPLAPGAYWSRRRAGAGTFEIAGNLPGPLFSRFTGLWHARVEAQSYLEMDRPFPGVRSLLHSLAGDHRLLMVTLRKDRGALVSQLQALGLERAFAEVICTDGNKSRSKSELLAGEPLDGETWVVGDSEADVALGREIGARTVCVSCGVRSPAFLRRAGADTLVDTPLALPALLAGVGAD